MRDRAGNSVLAEIERGWVADPVLSHEVAVRFGVGELVTVGRAPTEESAFQLRLRLQGRPDADLDAASFAFAHAAVESHHEVVRIEARIDEPTDFVPLVADSVLWDFLHRASIAVAASTKGMAAIGWAAVTVEPKDLMVDLSKLLPIDSNNLRIEEILGPVRLRGDCRNGLNLTVKRQARIRKCNRTQIGGLIGTH